MDNLLYYEIKANWLKNGEVLVVLKIALYASIAGILLNMSWNAWPDIIIDFGQELYIPWRITEGEVLYRDIDYFHLGGPLSIYWNALWFYIFGANIKTIIIANLVTLAVLVVLLENWLVSLSDKLSATIAVSFFLTVFGFGRYLIAGNYNYITPYSISLVQGLVIVLGLLLALKKWQDSKKMIWLSIAGILIGLAIINKLEVAFSAIATAMVYFASMAYINPKTVLNKNFLIIAPAIIAPPLLTVITFSWAMPIEDAAYNIFNQWVMLFDGRLSEFNDLLFYKKGLGIDDIKTNVLKLLSWSWVYINIALVGIFLALAMKKISRWKSSVGMFIVTITGLSAYFLVLKPTWFDFFRPLPLVVTLGGLFSVREIIKQKISSDSSSEWPFYLASFVFAGTILAKMALNARAYHYGFVLAMPATMLLIIAAIAWLPRLLNRYGNGWSSKMFFLGILISLGIIFAYISNHFFSANNFICCGRNSRETIMTDSLRGPVITRTINKLQTIMTDNQTFTVLPEGVMMNYLLKRSSPVPYFQFMPQLFVMYDDQTIIEKFSENPPDFIVFAHRDTTEYGLKFFGKNYAVELYDWLNKNYETIWQTGGKPFEPDTKFGMSIGRRIIK